jgi:hypothetical protein
MNNLRRISRFVNIKTILAAFVGLGTLYSFATPIFEKPDEPQHFAYLKMLADGRGFPSDLTSTAIDAPHQESSQPPLYYLVAALPVRLLAPNTDDFVTWLIPNLGTSTSLAVNDNKNMFIHLADERSAWPYTILAVHVARISALLLGAVAVWATYRIGREVFPGASTIALVAASIVAFLPQFLFISSSASNDSAAAAMCALALWVTVRIIRHGWTARRAICLGIALALAAAQQSQCAHADSLGAGCLWCGRVSDQRG